MSDALKHTDIISKPIEQGDAGVILRANGSFELFSCRGQLDPANMNDQDMKAGMTLAVFSYILKSEDLLVELFEKMVKSGYLSAPLEKPRLNA